MTLLPMMHCPGRRGGGSQRAGRGRWDLCCWSTLGGPWLWGRPWGSAMQSCSEEAEADAGSGVHRGLLLWEQALEAYPCSAVGG